MEAKRVAILAVHGVADQQPFESARAVSNVLLCRADYRPFQETTLRLEARAVEVAGDVQGFKEWASTAEPGNDAGHAFLKAQVKGAANHASGTPFETIRLESTRAGTDTEVHVYEMYWADLSRFGRGILRMLGEIYQILLHLPSVGVHTLRAAQIDHRGDSRWSALVGLHVLAARLLSVPIAAINLFMLACALTVALGGPLSTASEAVQRGTIGVAGSLLAGVIICWSLYKKRASLPLAAVAAIIAAIAVAVFRFLPPSWLAFIDVWAVGASSLGAVGYLLWRFERQRPGSRWWGLGTLAVAAVFSIASLFIQSPLGSIHAPEQQHTLYAQWVYLLRFLEIGAILNGTLWSVLYLLALVSSAVGVAAGAWRATADRRAWRTARLTLSGSAVFFTLITLLLWAGITQSFSPLLPFEETHAVFYRPLFDDKVISIPRFGEELLVRSSLLVPVILAGVLVVLLIAIIGLTPSILMEAIPPREDVNTSRRIGNWLTLANAALLWAGRILWGTVAFLMPLALVAILTDPGLYEGFKGVVRSIMTTLGAVIAGSAVGVFALGRNLKVLGGLLAPLDVVLDVDNYLREHPRGDNPTAHIFARYASMLRVICEWRDADGKPYDALIIVAHSQGTVITADLLRFLGAERDLPVYLFTMGSPLRNLYGSCFPHLYGWAIHDNRDPMPPFTTPDLIPDRDPEPGPLGVRVWVNAFRSGDYIGRYLWRSDVCDYAWDSEVSTDRASIRREFCVGAGAHTHYWDETAAAVARELDRLIVNV